MTACLAAWSARRCRRPASAADARRARRWGRVAFFGNVVQHAATASASHDQRVDREPRRSNRPRATRSITNTGRDVRFAGYPGSSDRSRRVSIYDALRGRPSARRHGSACGPARCGSTTWAASGRSAADSSRCGQQPRQGARTMARGAVRRSRAEGDGRRLREQRDQGRRSSPRSTAPGFAATSSASSRCGTGSHRALGDRRQQPPAARQAAVRLPGGRIRRQDGRGVRAGSLTYFFVNARYTANRCLEIQGSYHRGRSFDSRSIVRDQLDGRPVGSAAARRAAVRVGERRASPSASVERSALRRLRARPEQP